MIEYYHMTSYANLESIGKDGLIPKRGTRTKTIGDERCAVFFSEGIINSILIYSSLFHHYNSYAGEKGIRAIRYYKDIIEEYHKKSKIMPLDQEDINEMEASIKSIDQIKQIMEYKSFNEYIGDGVYLNISNIINVNSDNAMDCYTNEIISPKNIKVVVLRNKKTGDMIDFRENILSYFMSRVPIEKLINNIYNVVTIKNLKDLYDTKQDDIIYYNRNNFKIEKIPIRIYLEKNTKNKAIVKKR